METYYKLKLFIYHLILKRKLIKAGITEMEFFGEVIKSDFRKLEDDKSFWQKINGMIESCKNRKDIKHGNSESIS